MYNLQTTSASQHVCIIQYTSIPVAQYSHLRVYIHSIDSTQKVKVRTRAQVIYSRHPYISSHGLWPPHQTLALTPVTATSSWPYSLSVNYQPTRSPTPQAPLSSVRPRDAGRGMYNKLTGVSSLPHPLRMVAHACQYFAD